MAGSLDDFFKGKQKQRYLDAKRRRQKSWDSNIAEFNRAEARHKATMSGLKKNRVPLSPQNKARLEQKKRAAKKGK